MTKPAQYFWYIILVVMLVGIGSESKAEYRINILVPGCTDPDACNFDEDADEDDGSCEYDSCAGCTNPMACNYDALATIDDGSCILPDGCTEEAACNYSPAATCDDGSCEFDSCAGCVTPEACNFDPEATIDDGSCLFLGTAQEAEFCAGEGDIVLSTLIEGESSGGDWEIDGQPVGVNISLQDYVGVHEIEYLLGEQGCALAFDLTVYSQPIFTGGQLSYTVCANAIAFETSGFATEPNDPGSIIWEFSANTNGEVSVLDEMELNQTVLLGNVADFVNPGEQFEIELLLPASDECESATSTIVVDMLEASTNTIFVVHEGQEFDLDNLDQCANNDSISLHCLHSGNPNIYWNSSLGDTDFSTTISDNTTYFTGSLIDEVFQIWSVSEEMNGPVAFCPFASDTLDVTVSIEPEFTTLNIDPDEICSGAPVFDVIVELSSTWDFSFLASFSDNSYSEDFINGSGILSVDDNGVSLNPGTLEIELEATFDESEAGHCFPISETLDLEVLLGPGFAPIMDTLSFCQNSNGNVLISNGWNGVGTEVIWTSDPPEIAAGFDEISDTSIVLTLDGLMNDQIVITFEATGGPALCSSASGEILIELHEAPMAEFQTFISDECFGEFIALPGEFCGNQSLAFIADGADEFSWDVLGDPSNSSWDATDNQLDITWSEGPFTDIVQLIETTNFNTTQGPLACHDTLEFTIEIEDVVCDACGIFLHPGNVLQACSEGALYFRWGYCLESDVIYVAGADGAFFDFEAANIPDQIEYQDMWCEASFYPFSESACTCFIEYYTPTSIEETVGTEMIIYPNPGSGTFTVQPPRNWEGDYDVEVYGLDGQLLEGFSGARGMRFTMNLNHLPAGMYALLLHGAHGSLTQIIVVL